MLVNKHENVQPEQYRFFLNLAGWSDADIEPLAGDASSRRYFRINRGDATAMLMDSPPEKENPVPFLNAARWLHQNGLRAPRILAEQPDQGLILLEDFGHARMRDYLDQWPDDEEEVYQGAIDTLIALHKIPAGPFAEYTMAEYLREAELFIDWYCPAQNLSVDKAGFMAAWENVLAPLVERQKPGITVLRDYHAENIMLLGELSQQGLLDFQDALCGHRAYDLVSLLQDARRSVSEALEARMFDYYLSQTGVDPDEFLTDYALLGAQRNTKIIGIFTRLWVRDEKPRYLAMIPDVWAMLERDLAHPALRPVARWFDRNIPNKLRHTGGGTLAA